MHAQLAAALQMTVINANNAYLREKGLGHGRRECMERTIPARLKGCLYLFHLQRSGIVVTIIRQLVPLCIRSFPCNTRFASLPSSVCTFSAHPGPIPGPSLSSCP